MAVRFLTNVDKQAIDEQIDSLSKRPDSSIIVSETPPEDIKALWVDIMDKADDESTIYDHRRSEILVAFSNGKACLEQKNAHRVETDIANIMWMAFAPYYNYNTINSGTFKILGCKFL